jgi:8-oxo-dGTP diphosphatase
LSNSFSERLIRSFEMNSRKDQSKTQSSLYPQNPCAAVGAFVFKNQRVLLVKRGQPPAEGLWAIPGGNIKLGETLQQATEREVREETGLVIKAGDSVFTFDVIDRDESGRIRYHYVIVDLMAEYISGDLQPGDDALEARWVSPQEIKGLNVSKRTRQVLTQRFNFGKKPI